MAVVHGLGSKERKRDKPRTEVSITVRNTVASYDTAVEFRPQEKVITLRRVCSLFVCGSLALSDCTIVTLPRLSLISDSLYSKKNPFVLRLAHTT